jgi:hypothetical protein
MTADHSKRMRRSGARDHRNVARGDVGVFDTDARVLLALGRRDEAYDVVAQVVREDPKFAAVRDIVGSRGYRAYAKCSTRS